MSDVNPLCCMVMANPVQSNLWGPDMSHERASNRGKDGGAHTSPHETNFEDGILCLSKESLSTDVREITDASSLQLVQDGGTISLLSVDGEDIVDMYPYDQSVGDNTEWMKSKCKSLSIDFDGVGEENVGDILGLGSEPKVDNLMTIGGQFLSSGISEDSGIILCSDGGNLVTSSISSGNDAKCSDIIPICNMPDDLNSRTDQVLCPPSSQNNANVLLGSSASAPTTSVFTDLTPTLDVSSINFTSFEDKTIQKESTEELEQANQTSLLESTNFPTSSQSLLGSCSAVPSVSDTTLAGGILPNFLGIESMTTSPGTDLSILSEGNNTTVETLPQNSLLAVADGSDLPLPATTADDDSGKIDLSDPGNVTLAMISVSTDKDASSTQIVVNTSQGQQLYMFNTASLSQGQNTVNIVPVGQSSESATAVQSITSTQSSGSTGPYFLLPVVNGSVVGCALEGSLSQEESDVREADGLVCPEPGCGRTFTKLSKLKVHTMQHTGERPFKCSREGCDWAFTTAYKLKRHEESHEGKKDFYCDFDGCNRKFTTIYNLNTHRRLHTRPCTEVCPEKNCNARFPTKRHLEVHMKTHNGEEKPYRCNFPGCNAVFYSALSVGSHARIHKERETEFRCTFDGCGKVFDRMCRLKQHVRQHTGEKPYKCNFEGCTWAFTTASKLKRHSAKHLNLRKFKCDQCDKSFMRPEHLKGHLITHTGVKPFKCTVEGCDASFTARSSLYVHINKHNKEGSLTFYCPIDGCSRKYTTKSMLRTHILKHYMALPEGSGDLTRQEIGQLLLRGYTSDEEEGAEAKEPGTSMDGLGEEEEEEQFKEGGVEISRDQLTNAAVSQLLSLPVTINVETPGGGQSAPNTSQPTISLESSMRRAVLKNRSGCARTDFQSNHRISNQARQRWHQQRDTDTQVTETMDAESPTQSAASSDMLGLIKQDGEIFTAGDSSLSGLTFRDPDTGLTYVQTQLLQDDPPQAMYYSGETMGLSADSGDLNQSVLDMVPSHFTNTTINLNDLV